MYKLLVFVLALEIVSAADIYLPPEGGPSNPSNTQRGQYQVKIPKNGTTTTRSAILTPMWSDMRLKNYDTGNTCIYAASDNIIKTAVCDTQNYFVLKEIVPSGYAYDGWFQFTFKTSGYGTYCLQAGSKKGYGQASNGDKAIAASCVGDEPTQIWKNYDTWGGYFQYSDLGSGKCLCLEKSTGEAVMWDCNYYANNHWWDVWA